MHMVVSCALVVQSIKYSDTLSRCNAMAVMLVSTVPGTGEDHNITDIRERHWTMRIG